MSERDSDSRRGSAPDGTPRGRGSRSMNKRGPRAESRGDGPRSPRAPDYRNRDKKSSEGLDQDGRRLILGQQAVREAIRVHGPKLHEVLIEQKSSPRVLALKQFATDQEVKLREVSRAELDRLSGSQLHQGVAAFAEPLHFTPFSDLLIRDDLLAVALDGVVDPQNFGAVIRSAVGIANAPVIWAESSSAPLSPAAFRASAGAIEHATLCRVQSLHGTLAEAVSAGIEVVGLAPDADESLHELRLRGPTIMVIGSEQKGMGRAVRKSCTKLVRLTQSGAVQSLNASVAAGISIHAASVARLKHSIE